MSKEVINKDTRNLLKATIKAVQENLSMGGVEKADPALVLAFSLRAVYTTSNSEQREGLFTLISTMTAATLSEQAVEALLKKLSK
jgi:hypothetical protein